MMYDGIMSPTPEKEFVFIESLCVPKSKLCIEIGSFRGAATAMFCKYFNTVIAIDPFGKEVLMPGDRIKAYVGSPGTNDNFAIFMKNMEDRGLFPQVVPIIGTSAVLQYLPSLMADMVYVDDGHTYADCSRDLKMAHKHISDSGMVVVHDYLREGQKWGMIGVANAVNEVLENKLFVEHSRMPGVIALRRN